MQDSIVNVHLFAQLWLTSDRQWARRKLCTRRRVYPGSLPNGSRYSSAIAWSQTRHLVILRNTFQFVCGCCLFTYGACLVVCVFNCREGGHRIPSIVSWPAVVQGDTGRVSWEMIVTSDFLATIMDVLQVKCACKHLLQFRTIASRPSAHMLLGYVSLSLSLSLSLPPPPPPRRPAHQSDWGMDGRSILPLLKAPPTPAQTQMVYANGENVMPIHGMGWCVTCQLATRDS